MTPRLSRTQSREATASALRTAAWGLSIHALTRIIGVVFSSASMATAVGQAIAAEWGTGRVGVTWSDPHAPVPTTAQMARRAAIGLAIGVATASVVAVFLSVTNGALLERPARPAGETPWSLLAVGLVTAALTAIRDELVLHGVTLRALASVGSPVSRALACGLTSGAAALGDATASPRIAISQFFLGALLGSLWVRDRGAWMAWGAHTAWLFVMGTLLRGGVVDMRVGATSWGGGDAGLLGGTGAMLALAAAAVVALAGARRAEPR